MASTLTISLYCIENIINGKKYIGKTARGIDNRWSQHKSEARRERGSNYALYRAIRKYGDDSFLVKRLTETNDPNTACELERLYILMYHSYVPEYGYNCTMGGEGNNPTEETLKKFGPNKGRIFSPEWRKNISLGQIGRIIPEKTRLAVSAATKGIPRTDEVKLKISKAQKGMPRPWLVGRTVSIATREKISAAQRGKNGPQYRSDILDKDIIALYASGMSLTSIGKRLKFSKDAVKGRLIISGVSIRSRSEAIALAQHSQSHRW